MTSFLDIFSFSFSVTGPIFVTLALGVLLRHTGVIDEAFVARGSRLVFNISLPTLLFLSVAGTRLDQSGGLGLIAFGLGGTLLAFALLEWLAHRYVQPPRDRGVVVQGGFRSNMGIVGLAYCMNAYGQAGLARASLFVGIVTILFNILAILTLSRSLQRGASRRGILRGVVTNPLILGIVSGLPFSWQGWTLPGFLLQSAHDVASLSLPLALLCTGAALNFGALRSELHSTMLASAAKLIGLPLLFAGGGALLGFRGQDLGILLLLNSAPTAAASYVMTRALNGNDALAANIIAMTTLGSILTTALGLGLLRAFALA